MPRFQSPSEKRVVCGTDMVARGASHSIYPSSPFLSLRTYYARHADMSSRARQEKANKLAQLAELKRAREGGKRTYKVRVHERWLACQSDSNAFSGRRGRQDLR